MPDFGGKTPKLPAWYGRRSHTVFILVAVLGLLHFLISVFRVCQKRLDVQYDLPESSSKCRDPDIVCHPFFTFAGVVQQYTGGSKTFVWEPDFLRPYWHTGNRLSAYWNARAMAHFAGASFLAGPRMAKIYNESWLKHLPLHVQAPSCPNPVKYASGCFGCAWGRGPYDAFQYPHTCEGAWTQFRGQVQVDTRAAINLWLQENAVTPHAFAEDDVVVQFRCARDTLVHAEYGHFAYSCYRNVVTSKTKRLFLLVDPHSKSVPVCKDLLSDVTMFIQATYPNVSVTLKESGVEESFVFMMSAPILLRNSQSSFGLWAGLSGSNTVFSAPMISYLTLNTTPALGLGWNWLSCGVLYPEVAKKNGVSMTSSTSIIQWLRTH